MEEKKNRENIPPRTIIQKLFAIAHRLVGRQQEQQEKSATKKLRTKNGTL